MASSISFSFFPGPAKTISSPLKPAFFAKKSSPAEAISAPHFSF